MLRQIPSLGPIRSALAVALIQTPHRFRTKRQLWAYSGLALETRTSGEHRYVQGQLRRSKKQISIRGLNKDHNHDLKGLFKAAATRASVQPGPFQDFYQRSLAKGIKPTMVRLTLARKIAAVTLTLWKKGENFEPEKLENNINQTLLGADQKPASFMLLRGWKSSNSSLLPVEGEIFFLTFPFIEGRRLRVEQAGPGALWPGSTPELTALLCLRERSRWPRLHSLSSSPDGCREILGP
jgi:hypothetical protein